MLVDSFSLASAGGFRKFSSLVCVMANNDAGAVGGYDDQYLSQTGSKKPKFDFGGFAYAVSKI